MNKRLTTLVCVALLCATLFAGCQATPAAESAAQTPDATAAPAATQPPAPEESPATRYDFAYLQTLQGGFSDTIEARAKEQGLTLDEFRALCEKPASDMTAEELAKMNAIRSQQIVPDSDTLMQKVITLYDMEKYLSGEYKTPKGFLSASADVKQYKTTQDMYYGLRLDYEGTYFKPTGENYAVIRFYADNLDQAIVPRSPANGGTVEDPYPFGGAGFTTGTNGRLGSPEWVMPEFTVLQDGAQLFEVQEDGTEVLRGVYAVEAGQFVPVNA